ncbi:MAG: ribosome maturation factor RimP [Desulfotomaculaceae bacterium]|nr:ribosome maturation factor RimP [Desulfotomaculaceae bacterium]
MSKLKTADIVKEMVLPLVQELGLELVDVEFAKEGGQWRLRIFIDKPAGVGIEDCQRLSEELNGLLDKKDPIPQSYVLEVSSPGIERPLKKPDDYDRFAGSLVTIKTFIPFGNKRKFTGRIIGINGNRVTVDVEGVELILPYEQIASARLKVEF